MSRPYITTLGELKPGQKFYFAEKGPAGYARIGPEWKKIRKGKLSTKICLASDEASISTRENVDKVWVREYTPWPPARPGSGPIKRAANSAG